MTKQGREILNKLMEGKSQSEIAREMNITRQSVSCVMHARSNVKELENFRRWQREQIDNQIEKIVELKKQRKTNEEIAEFLGISKHKLGYIISKYGDENVKRASHHYISVYKIGQEIKKRGMTLKEISEKSKIPAASLQGYLCGTTKLDIEIAKKIKNAIAPEMDLETAFKILEVEENDN